MKVRIKNGITGYKGKSDGMVYYYLPNCEVTIGRSLPESFTEAAQHKDYRAIAQNLRKIKPSQAYKDDFKVYTALYKEMPERDFKVSSWYNLYIRLMWDLQRAGLIDLKTVTKAQIVSGNLPCKSVKNAVEAGLLLPVLNWQTLDNSI